MNARKVVVLLAGFCIGLVLAGCGGLGSLPPISQPSGPTSVIFVATPPKSLAVNASATLYAAAIYPLALSANTAVTYSVSCGSTGACGVLSASDELGAIVYTAPSAVPTGGTVTVKATSAVDTSLSASATITIVPPIPITVSFFGGTPASVQVSATIPVRAGINNDVSANPEARWTVTCGGSDCGAFNPTTTTDEAATAYTAPAAIPPGTTVTVTATSVTDPTKSVSAGIVITAAAPTLANGTYVFQLPGPTGNGASFITGAIVASNGAITGGEQDSVYGDSGDGASALLQQITGGSYATTSDGNMQITLQLGAYETETLTGTLVSGGHGFVAGLDGVPGTGTLDLQTSTASPSGGYAISLYGADTFSNPVWIGGVVNVDGAGKISGTGSVLDVVGGGPVINGTQTLSASTVSAPDAYGRVVFQLNPGATATLPSVYLAGYMVDATHIRLSEIEDTNGNYSYQGVMGGTALGQGASTGHFSASSIAGSSYVFGAQGMDAQGTLQVAGMLTANADGTVKGLLNWNDLSAMSPQNPAAFTGTYTVDSTGRVTLSNLTDGAGFHYSFHLYLTGSGGGLLVSNDGNDEMAGEAFEQQSGAFSASSFSGNYGLSASLYAMTSYGVPQFGNAIGKMTATAANGTDTMTGFADPANGGPDFAVSASFTAAPNGVFVGTVAGFNSADRTTAGDFTLYVVDDTRAVLIETDRTELLLGAFDRVQ